VRRTKQVSKPYFREWSNMKFHKGKTFLAPPRLFRADKALYFPNLQGVTLAMPRDPQDTTTVLEGKVSIVSLFSGAWGEKQTETFVEKNPELDKILHESHVIQKVDLNVEENALKAGLIRMFMPGLRKKLPEAQHDRYFLVRKGINDEMRDDIGYVNSKVGYVYLVDGNCRIRWAGSGPASKDERESIVRGALKLEQEAQEILKEQQRQAREAKKEAKKNAIANPEAQQPRKFVR
jgi:ATPase complex subunit ATP10